MNEKWQKGIKDLQNMCLSENEKASMFTRILGRSPYAPIKSPWTIKQFVFVRRHSVVFALFLIVVLSTGTAFASERALPGGLLYPIKVKITEPARDLVKLVPEQKIEWQAKKAERRLEEAEALSAENNLDDAKIKEIETLFDKHTKEFKAETEKEIEKEVEKDKAKAREVMEKKLDDLEKAREETFKKAKKNREKD